MQAKSNPHRTFSQQGWFPVVVIGGAAVLCIAALWYARHEALTNSAELTRSVTGIVTEQAARSVEAVEYRLLHVSTQFSGPQAPTGAAARALLEVERAALPHCQGLALLDGAGHVLFSASNRSAAQRDEIDPVDAAGIRAVVARVHRSASSGPLFELIQVDGKTTIYAALARRAADGAILAIAVSRLAPAYFSALWNGVDLGRDGRIGMLRSDGMVIAALPASGAGLLHFATTLSRRTADATHLEIKYLTRRAVLPGYPDLQVAASRSQHALLAPWRNLAMLVTLFWLIGSAAFTGLFLLLRRSLDRAHDAVSALHRSDQKFAAAFRASPDGILLTSMDSGRFIEVSDSVTRMTGYSRAELLDAGMTTASLWVDPAARAAFLDAVARDGRVIDVEARFRIKSGEERIGSMSGEIVRSDNETLVMGIVRDITDTKRREQLIWEQGNFDSLTGLPNRHMFRNRLEALLAESQPAASPFVVLLIDLDQFKEVNDTLGHAVGDQLLVAVAGRLRATLGDEVSVARLGGDEFTVLLRCEEEAHGAPEAIVGQLIRALALPFTLGADIVFVSASIGVARYPDAGAGAEELLRHADQAMYAAKSAGRNRFCHFEPSLQAAAQERATLTNDLRGALAGGQFALAFQPIVDMRDQRINKAEALLRWEHPVRGQVSPAEFIPVAEQSGQIIAIGDWVFQQAASVLGQLRAEIDPHFEISINVSPVQFQNDHGLPARWLAHLAERGIDPGGITVEITEGLLLNMSAEVRTSLAALGRAGMQIALDDFGTGYSSLAYLKKFDIDFLKIDRAFVEHIETDAEDRALCQAIVAMAHTLGLRVTVEGVETAGQFEIMQHMACDYAQGYFLSRAVPAASLKQLCAA
ncbi:bifunctional diguanylate cyclase/phosphodiesterase [Massilia sp. S19_KUP03_FR1]|uniref:bifunctional diguanylate cyclase/phosphodiesterase n=1 Tax=Massilia sp. S19_KUP03_FR1 TaxID=3025503 RepID=UPI002FCD9C30